MPTIGELKDYLSAYPDDEICANSIWLKEDVMPLREGITDEIAESVLESVHENFDANHGITWETIEAELDNQMEPTLDDKITFIMWDLKSDLGHIFEKMRMEVSCIRVDISNKDFDHNTGRVLFQKFSDVYITMPIMEWCAHDDTRDYVAYS